MRIPMKEYENSSSEVKELWDEQVEKHGRITNMKKTLLNHVPSFKVLMEWYPLRDSVAQFAGDFATDVFAYAISTQDDCLICSTFFRKILKDNGKDPDNLELGQTEQLLWDYGRACGGLQSEHCVDDELFARLKEKFTDEQIVLLTAFAGMMIATNLINNALEVELDDCLQPYTKR